MQRIARKSVFICENLRLILKIPTFECLSDKGCCHNPVTIVK